MRNPFHFLTVSAWLGAFWLSACGPNLAFLAERSRSEAQALQQLCRQGSIQAEEIAKADAMLEESSKLWKEGKAEKARMASEEAAGYYRLALSRDARGKAMKELETAEADLAKEKEKLATYKEILDEMKTMRKP